MKNSWKRVAASAVSLVTVAGMLPANVGGILPGGTTIVANAEGSETNPGADNSQNESATDLTVTIDTNSEEELGETLSDDEGKFILSDFETTHEEDPQAEDNKYYISLEKAADDDEEATDKTLKIEKGSGYPGLVIESVSATDEEGNDIGAFLSFDSATGILSMREAASKKVAGITITYKETILTADDFNVVLPTNLEYSGEPKEAVVTPNNNLTGVEYSVTYHNSAGSVVDPINAGTYTFSVTVSAENGYGTSTITPANNSFTITKAHNALENESEIAELQNVTDLNQIKVPTPKYGEVEYRIGNSGEWVNFIPDLVNNAQTTIQYRVQDTQSYDGLIGSFDVFYRGSLIDSDFVEATAGNAAVSYRHTDRGTIDVQGKSGDTPIQVTFANGGFYTFMSVNNNQKNQVGTQFGQVTKQNDVQVKMVPTLEEKGVRLTYTIANIGFEDKNVRIGGCGDTMLNGNDSCEVTYDNNSSEILMQNGDCKFYANVFDGSDGTKGNRWVGLYYANTYYQERVFDNGNDYEQNRDSAIAWSWDVTLPAGEIKTFEVLLSPTCEPTVSYNVDYAGGVNPPTENVVIGQQLETPVVSRYGYDFVRWHYDKAAYTEVIKGEDGNEQVIEHQEELKKTFNSGDTITGSLRLTAEWKKHEYTYAVDGNKITATCSNDEHPSPQEIASLTLNIPSETKNYDGEPFEASITETGDFVAEVGAVTGVEPKIHYVGINGTEYDDTTEAPSGAGHYKAYVTVAENYTVSGEFSILEKFDLTDDHENDPDVGRSNLVREAILSISIDADNNGTFEESEITDYSADDTDPDEVYFYPQGQKTQIISKAKLVFTDGNGAELDMNEGFDDTGYTYNFDFPKNVNEVIVKRVYNYSGESRDNKLYVKDENVARDYSEDRLVATLDYEDFEYNDILSDHIKIKIEEDFELRTITRIFFKTADGLELTEAPEDIGTYTVIAVVATNGQEYQINGSFEITPRNYATHSGANAVPDNKIETTLNFEGNKTIYNKETQTPVVTITDTLRGENKELVRGTDYELGCINAETGEFEVVAEADDEAKFGAINAGEYAIYVHFIGNYMNKVEGEEKYEEIKWSIVEKELTAADVTAPTAGTLTYNTEDQLLLVNGGGAGQIGVVYYRLGEEGEFTTEIPKAKDAGVYTVYWYVKGDSDHTDYTAANGEDAITVKISPKQITPTIEPSEDTFTYDGNEKKYTTVTVKDGDTVIDASEYEISYESNTNAGENTAKLIVKDAKNNVDAAVGAETTGNYTIIEKTTNFSIAQADATITIAPKTIVYDGEAVNITDFTINETNADTNDCTLKFYADNEGEKGEELTAAPVNAGTYWVEASVAETTNFNTVTSEAVKFTIAPKDITGEGIVDIIVGEANETAADGTNPAEPTAITVKDVELNADMIADKDFEVEYDNNINSGAAVVTVNGKGNYTGTATSSYNVLSVLDISAVKDLITSITYEDQTITDQFEETYKYRTGVPITIVSKGVLKFGDLTDVVSNKTNAGYVYIFAIPAGTNRTAVTHIYNYSTSKTTDPDTGVVTIWGTDNNILNNTQSIELATLHIDPVYYLDDADEKIILTDKHAPSVKLEKGVYTYTRKSNSASLVDGKPLNAGNYSVEVRVDLTDGDGTENIYINKDFTVLARPYDDDEIKAVITNSEYTYCNSAITPEIIVTDIKRVDGEQLLKKGTDYTLTGATAKIDAGNYKIDVNFVGNYSGKKELSWKIDPKNIESDDVSITYPRVSVLEPTGWTKCDPIVITDNGKTLAEGTDYKTYRDTTNRIREGLAVLINGEGNYTGNLYLDWDVISKPEITLTETGVKDAANKKIWIKVDTNSDNADAIARTGVLIYKLGENMTADGVNEETMTIENKDALGLVQGSKAGNTYSPSVSNSNTGYGFLIRPYTELVGGTIVYGDIVDTSYEAVACANANASVELSGSGVKNATDKKIWIKVDAAADYEGVVEETGVLIYKLNENRIASDVTPENMTIENKDALGLVQGKKSSNTYSPSVSNGDNGFVLRTYTKLVDGSVVYGDLVETSYAAVASATANAAVEISNIGVKDAANKKIWIKVDSTADNADAVAKTGVLIYKLDGNKKAEDVNADNMTVENKDALGLVQGSKAGNTYSPSVSNGDNGFVLRSYTELIDGSYVYGELITTSYAEVAAE